MFGIRVGLELPTVEVRFKNLSVEAECEVVHRESLPNLWNTIRNTSSEMSHVEQAMTNVSRCMSQPNKIKILRDVSGIIKPSRMTLLLGPPGCGKTTLLKALAGKLGPSLEVISILLILLNRLSVNEDILKEVSRREKLRGIIPEPDIDTYMKILGLDNCADTIVGDAMKRGISGGEKRRLTTGIKCDQPNFQCPQRKGLADFLQQVLSEKDQAQYWYHMDRPQSYVSTDQFFFEKVSTDQFIAAFKEFHAGQKLNEELCTPFNKVENHKNALSFSIYSLGKWELFKACLAREWLLMKRNSIFYVFKSVQYIIGYSPEPERFFRQLFLFFLLQVAISFFRLIAAVAKKPPVAAIFGQFSLLVVALFSGFIIPQPSMPAWIKWGFWISPLTYTEIGISINEFLAPRWQKVSSSNETLGHQVLRSRGLNFGEYFYWISVGALIGMWILINVGFTLALSYLKPPGRSRAILSHERFSYLRGKEDLSNSIQETQVPGADSLKDFAITGVTRTVLPFEPVTLSFENVQYFVDTPKKLREQGFPQKKLHLLQDISGAFRPGVLTALMGASGAGKTTLMDVLSGRKTGGHIEGDIRIGEYPKVQEAYARISGYCEQTDIHSPQITVGESVMYSAWLRLPAEFDKHKRLEFVAEVLQMIELDEIKDALVGVTGVSGILSEQRKRLTIAVEVVSNPSIIFMDEPTSGLDARAAAIVMRVVKNISSTRRTIVCTIHQPSIDIFEAFDEVILMKRGGHIIYSGELGLHSSKLVEYFEGIPGVPKIKENYNPATWMLEITNPSAEARLGVDFAHLYKESHLYQRNKELVKELSIPVEGSKELRFSTRFPQNGWEQFKACLWKQHLSYWRNPAYNLGRLMFTTVSSFLYGALLWQKGQKIDNEQDLFNIMGSMYVFMMSTGVSNCVSFLPLITSQRIIVYRERFAGSKAYSLAQVIIEIPYIFIEAALFLIITYPAVNLYGSAYKVFWYFYAIFCTMLNYKYLGMVIVSLTPTYQAASICASYSVTVLNLFSGFLIPGPQLPKWWVWCYWIAPSSWTLRGLLTSQYGDIKQEIIAFGERKTISAFLEGRYGFKHHDLSITAILLIAYPLFSASVFTYFMAKLNFQKR
ncbi:hypothetical protein SCA6_014866 [Theobroma cacao]